MLASQLEEFECDCGFKWLQGKSGQHQCGSYYQAKIEKLELKLKHKTALSNDSIAQVNKADQRIEIACEILRTGNPKFNMNHMGDVLICSVSQVVDAFNGLKDENVELKESQPSIENGTNRYGVDVSYFRNVINRELNRSLRDFKPDELARVFARMARTACEEVLTEAEFN